MTNDADAKETPETWQQVLKSTNLRAMSGTLRQVERLIGNDETTAKQLADIILKDATLTPHVLMVANSATHLPAATEPSNEGALTQAIIRIGFKGLRAICISVAIMDSFLKKMPSRPELQACIAQSFDVAVHARNVAKKMSVNEEDVFIAGMLQNLGELVFWCSTIPDSQVYLDLMDCAADSPEQAFKKLSGMDFQDMSKELATEWALSDLLQETFGVNLNDEIKAVHLGRRISLGLKQGWDSPAINKLLQGQLSALGFDIMNGMSFIRAGADEASALAASYSPHVTEQPKKIDPVTEPETLPSEPLTEGKANSGQANKLHNTETTSLIRP